MAVRRQGEPALRFQQQTALKPKRGQNALRKQGYFLLSQAKEIVRPEVLKGLLVIGRACHDVPGNRGAVARASGFDHLREKLKKRSITNRCHYQGSLGSLESKPRALAAGDGEGCDLTGAEQIATGADSLVVQRFLARAGLLLVDLRRR